MQTRLVTPDSGLATWPHTNFLHLYAETKIPSFISPPPNCPQKPTTISSKIKILLMHKGGGKKEKKRDWGKYRTMCTDLANTSLGFCVRNRTAQPKSLAGLWALLQLYLYRFHFPIYTVFSTFLLHLHLKSKKNVHLLWSQITSPTPSPWLR